MFLLKSYKTISDYCIHNKSIFKKKIFNENKILVEFNKFQPSHVPISYLSNYLSKKYNSSINAFFNYSLISSPLIPSYLDKFKWYIGNFLSIKTFRIYRSFGTAEIFRPSIKSKKIKKKKIDQYLNKIKTKNQLLNFKIYDITIGDLIYDTYLKKYQKPTLEIKDINFQNLFRDFVKLFFYWFFYFKNNNVKAVIGVHSVYSYGLILRIAIKNGIPTFVTSNRFIYKLNSKMPFMHGQFKKYPLLFSKLKRLTKQNGIIAAKKKLNLRFSGIGGAKVDLITSQISSFKKSSSRNLIKKNNKIKILIAPHDFFDAAHIWGSMLFSDFYEWLIFLGELSKKTNYDWYLKNRPNHPGKFKKYQPYTNKILKKFVKKYKNIKLLPNNYSHNQILSEGINFVLTCYGSVAMEYAYFKVPVINASINNPHIAYNFNINPRSIKEYENILLNLKKFKKFKNKINQKKVIEYYFMRHLFVDKNWLVEDLSQMIKFVGGYDNQWSDRFYEYWLKNFSLKKHNQIINNINRFMTSNDNFININHTNKMSFI